MQKVVNNVDTPNCSLTVSLYRLSLPVTLGHLSVVEVGQEQLAEEIGQSGKKLHQTPVAR